MITTKGFRNISLIIIPLMGIAFYLWPSAVMANDHKRNESHLRQYESGKDSFDSNDRKNRRLKSKDEGNELTGLTTAWLLGAANLTVLLSLLLKGANRYLPLKPETKSAVRRFNQFQKTHLMRFHFEDNRLINSFDVDVISVGSLVSADGGDEQNRWGICSEPFLSQSARSCMSMSSGVPRPYRLLTGMYRERFSSGPG